MLSAVAALENAIEAIEREVTAAAERSREAQAEHQALKANSGSRIEAELKAERLDLDAATAFARSLAGPQAEWPDEGLLALDIGRAISSGQELRPLVATGVVPRLVDPISAMRYSDISLARESPRTSNVTRFANREKYIAACPAELAPPTI